MINSTTATMSIIIPSTFLISSSVFKPENSLLIDVVGLKSSARNPAPSANPRIPATVSSVIKKMIPAIINMSPIIKESVNQFIGCSFSAFLMDMSYSKSSYVCLKLQYDVF